MPTPHHHNPAASHMVPTSPSPSPSPSPTSPGAVPLAGASGHAGVTGDANAGTVSPLNGSSIEIDAGGTKIKLPTLLLVHVLSMLGAFGGTYQLTKSDKSSVVEETKALVQRVQQIEHTQAQMERTQSALVDRLTRIEEKSDAARQDIRELRQWLRGRAYRDQ